MYKVFAFIGLFLVFILVVFLDSPKSEFHQSTITSMTLEEQEVDASATNTDKVHSSNASLEYILEEVKVESKYIVEVYQEYEIYKDEDGNIIERIPTSNFNYLRYEQ